MISPVLPVYRRSGITMVRGEGCYLFDDAGKKYLDFATGIAVNSLGHSHPYLVQALQKQAAELWHCSNMYWNPGLTQLAKRLVEITFADSVFFCSSGAEAVECGLKMARRYQDKAGHPNRFRTITFEGGFHGRTFGGISAGGNETAREGYGPLLEGFDRVPFGDMAAVERAVTPDTACILIEPIQGEGGVRVADGEFLNALRALCDARELLLFFDEVQCGSGRSGYFLAHEEYGAAPDIATIAKGIGGGFPLGACLATEKVAACMTPGSHGSTYGGNPLAMAAGNAVLDVMLAPDFFSHVREMGARLREALSALTSRYPHVLAGVRGKGLMLGLEMRADAQAFASRLRENGLLAAPAAGGGVIRILPPLIIEPSHIAEAVRILSTTCDAWSAS